MKNNNGFTLTELLIAMAISAVLLMLAAPGFAEMIRNNRLTSGINTFNNALNLSRSTAVKQMLNVTVCKSIDQASCTTNGSYSGGWISFVDDGATIGTVDAGETILQAYQGLSPKISIVATAIGASNAANFITYDSDGSTRDRAQLLICDQLAGNYGKILHIGLSGRNRIENETACP